MSLVWFITGCSGGFGRAVAEAALARGDNVIGTLRRAEQCTAFEQLAPGRAHAAVLDVRDSAAVGSVVRSAIARYDRIDVAFNNAGRGMLGAVEETSLEEAKDLFDANFFGAFSVTRALLPQLRKQGAGHVLNMSSGAGIGAVPGLGMYSASKFALEGLSEALAAEVAAFGVKVTIIEPGAFMTGFATGAAAPVRQALRAYAPLTGQVAAGMQHWYSTQAGDPLRLVLGGDALHGVRAKIDSLRSNVDAWEFLTLSTSG
jgi:NAD(P)-dependent dehydrogenase (short-subunit alcohol dehydrogenase family)